MFCTLMCNLLSPHLEDSLWSQEKLDSQQMVLGRLFRKSACAGSICGSRLPVSGTVEVT